MQKNAHSIYHMKLTFKYYYKLFQIVLLSVVDDSYILQILHILFQYESYYDYVNTYDIPSFSLRFCKPFQELNGYHYFTDFVDDLVIARSFFECIHLDHNSTFFFTFTSIVIKSS